jgi:hypothetical protein
MRWMAHRWNRIVCEVIRFDFDTVFMHERIDKDARVDDRYSEYASHP